jgi:hypothetical protein
MPNPSRKRTKPRLEPISLAELEADSTMVGFTSLFRIPTTEAPLPHVAAAIEAEPTVGAEKQTTVGSEPSPTVGDTSQPTVGDGRDPEPTVGAGLAFFQSLEGKLYPGQRVRPLLQPRDVLSPVELRVLDTLERLAGGERQLRIGYDRLAEQCSLNEKTVRQLLVRLQEKGFLSVAAPADPNRQLGKRYEIHTLEHASHYHHQQGWQWVVRSGNGVLVVKPVSA